MVQAAGLLFWLVIIPFCIGLIPAYLTTEEKKHPGFIFLAGYFTMWALYGIETIPVVLFVKYDNFILASNLFLVSSVLCAATGAALTVHKWRKAVCGNSHSAGSAQEKTGRRRGALSLFSLTDHIRRMTFAQQMEWLLFLLLLGFQLYKAVAYASMDGDDAYYVVESLIAQQADTMYSILPYTGRHTGLDIRHALAVFPMWIAFVAQKSHVHATILSHTILPFVLIPLTYLVYYEIGRRLFGGGEEKQEGQKTAAGAENLPLFMILMAVFQIFGNGSIYTNETFFLTRTWQGKAVAGSLVIPALLWLFVLLYRGGVSKSASGGQAAAGIQRAGIWFLLVCVNITAGICSSIAVFLVSILMAATALCLAFVERDYKVVIKMGAVCIPNVIYVLAYLVMGYSYLFR